MYSGKCDNKKKGAEGSIYTGKRQDTRRWSILPYHILPHQDVAPNVLYYRNSQIKEYKSR